jgi:Uncharacterised nucleotidyltransferase
MTDGGGLALADMVFQLRGELQTAHALDSAPDGVTHSIERVLHLCARRTLGPTDEAELATAGAQLDTMAWREVGVRARTEGLEGLVLTHAATAGLLRQMPPEVTSDLLEAYRAAWIGNRQLRGVLAEVLAAFAARGVEAMAVKGVALALRYYGEPALRPAGDLDLLVRRADLAACRTALEALGCRPYLSRGQPRGFYPLLFRALVYLHPSGLTIELHWELTSLPAYLPRLRADIGLWTRVEHIEVLGQPAHYLVPADELRYLALHAIVQHAENRRMIWLVDISELVRSLPPSWDWDAFVEETVLLGLARPVAAALLAAQELGPLPVPSAALERLCRAATAARERRAWRHSLGSEAGVRRPGAVLRALRWQDSMVDRAVFLWHLIRRAQRRWSVQRMPE